MSILGVPVISLGGDKKQVNDNIYELTLEKLKALLLTSYTGKSMKNENDQRALYNFLVDVGYTGDGDRKTNQKNFFTRLFNSFENNKKEEPDILEGQRFEKISNPATITDNYTGLEILLVSKLSGHTDTLTQASNLIDELYKRSEIQNKQQYQNALDIFHT